MFCLRQEARSCLLYRDPGLSGETFCKSAFHPECDRILSELGIEGKHLIGMQGPFSTEMNDAMLRQYDCRYLVTKDTGLAGGFPEKMEACQRCGVTPVIIGRPLQEEGLSLPEARVFLAKLFGLTLSQRISLVGIGMGAEKTLTLEGKKAFDEAELLIGAKRMTDAVQMPGQMFSMSTAVIRSWSISRHIHSTVPLPLPFPAMWASTAAQGS